MRCRRGGGGRVVILDALVSTRAEASVAILPLDRDERLFFIHPCWVDEAPFGCPAGEPRSRRSRYALMDYPLDVRRTLLIS